MTLIYDKTASSNHSVNSSANNFPELVMLYMDFNNLKDLPKYFAYSGNQSVYLLSNFTNTLFFTFAYKNAPMKNN